MYRVNLAASSCVLLVEEGDILDTTNTIGIPNFDGSDANWEGWRVKFEAYAALANVGTHLDVAAKKSSFISLLVSKNGSCLAFHEMRKQSFFWNEG